MIDVSGSGANGFGENMGHEMMGPRGFGGPGGGVGVDGEKGGRCNGGLGVGIMGPVRGKKDRGFSSGGEEVTEEVVLGEV